jgi:hypothetical protein
MSGQHNPDARATFLAALEFGVSPLLTGDLYAKSDPTPRPVTMHAPRARAATASPRTVPVRPTHTRRRTSMVRTAADIMNEVNA